MPSLARWLVRTESLRTQPSAFLTSPWSSSGISSKSESRSSSDESAPCGGAGTLAAPLLEAALLPPCAAAGGASARFSKRRAALPHATCAPSLSPKLQTHFPVWSLRMTSP
eukprot:6694689-Prymnesium_polylepis.2